MNDILRWEEEEAEKIRSSRLKSPAREDMVNKDMRRSLSHDKNKDG